MMDRGGFFLHILYEFHEIKLNVMKYALCFMKQSERYISQCILALRNVLQRVMRAE